MNPELLAAAVMAAGPGATDGDIIALVIRMRLMAELNSPAFKQVERVMTAQRFTADLVAVDIEESSTRAILTLRSDSADAEDGLEQIRSDRTDHPDGARMADQARTMIGRRVLVFKAMEDAGPQKKVRVCVHLIDLGEAKTADTDGFQGWRRRHWEEAAASAGVRPEKVLEVARHYAPRHNYADHMIENLDRIPESVAVDVRRWLDKIRAAR